MTKNTPMQNAEIAVQAAMDRIEKARVRKGVSMRALSAAAGLRPTSYWGIIHKDGGAEAVKATTLFALTEAIGKFPG